MEISRQGTPNPNAAKFTLNRVVAAQGVTYRQPAAQAGAGGAAVRPDWADQLLGIAGVTQVFALNNFISINKTPDGDWDVIGPEVERVLKQAFA